MGSILLATDGSEYARKAADREIELAEERDSALHVICVVDRQKFDDPALSSAELATIYAEDHAVVTVNEVTQMADGRAVRVEGETRHGVPHETIVAYADEVDADVIVVGEHGDHDRHFSGVGQKIRNGGDYEVVVVEAES